MLGCRPIRCRNTKKDEPNCAPSAPTRSASYRELIAVALGEASADFSDDIMKAYGREMFDVTEGNTKSTTKTGVGHKKNTSRWC